VQQSAPRSTGHATPSAKRCDGLSAPPAAPQTEASSAANNLCPGSAYTTNTQNGCQLRGSGHASTPWLALPK
jgi:hypothetical protein